MSQNAQCETRITDLTPGIWAGMYDIICSLNYSQLIKLESDTEPQLQQQCYCGRRGNTSTSSGAVVQDYR